MEINDVRCSKKELKQVQSILKKNFKLFLKVRSNLPGTHAENSPLFTFMWLKAHSYSVCIIAVHVHVYMYMYMHMQV